MTKKYLNTNVVHNSFWDTDVPTQIQKDVASLAAYLHYQQSDKTGWWDTIKLANGAIHSVKWRSRPSWHRYESISFPEASDPQSC